MSTYDGLHFELGIRGLQALASNFHASDERLQTEARQLVLETAGDIRTLAEMLAPKRTGFMAEHIKEFFTPSGLGFEVGWDAEDFYSAGFAFYPYFQEFGTRVMAAQPSIGPAADDRFPAFQQRMGDLLRQAMARAAGGSV
jgi:HK97 gp10 family phage protein